MTLKDLFAGRVMEEADTGGSGGGGTGGGTGDAGGNGNKDTLLGSAGDAGAGDPGGEGDAGNAGDGGDGDQASQSGEWLYADGVPGTGERPAWFKGDKYKTVTAQAEAVPGLEAKLGPAAELIGAPEGDYELPAVPEGLEGEWDPEDPLLKAFVPLAKKMNLSNKAFDQVLTEMAGVIGQQNEADNVALSEAIQSLGQNASARIAAVDQYLTQTVGEDGWNALRQALGTNVAAYNALEKVVGVASGDAQLSGGTGQGGPSIDQASIETERYKVFPEGHKLAGKVMYEHDKDHRQKVDDMWKKLKPGDDVTIVS